MTGAVIITFCLLVLVSYLFDLTSSKTKIPSAILLLLLGWGLNQITSHFSWAIPDMSSVLPILGTVGLILIVLEGSLELDFSRKKLPMIGKAMTMASLTIAVLIAVGTAVLVWMGHTDIRSNILNIIPLCVISSAIAIPSVSNLSKHYKEFVVYESSLSDVMGILIFNFFTVNQVISFGSVAYFSFQMVLIVLISLVASVALTLLLKRINHHIKYVPIVFIIILIYEMSKEYELPGLLFILIFGLFLGNLRKLKVYSLFSNFNFEVLRHETPKFKEQVAEVTFLVRSLFFILFGYSIQTSDLLDVSTLWWSLGICGLIYVMRLTVLRVLKMPLFPLTTVAPRGLISILLFLSILPEDRLPFFNQSMIVQVMFISIFVMMLGLMFHRSPKGETQELTHDKRRV